MTGRPKPGEAVTGRLRRSDSKPGAPAGYVVVSDQVTAHGPRYVSGTLHADPNCSKIRRNTNRNPPTVVAADSLPFGQRRQWCKTCTLPLSERNEKGRKVVVHWRNPMVAAERRAGTPLDYDKSACGLADTRAVRHTPIFPSSTSWTLTDNPDEVTCKSCVKSLNATLGQHNWRTWDLINRLEAGP